MAQKKYEIDMINGPILPKLLQFSLPLMVSSVLQLLFNAADIVVVGRFAGDHALAAVGCTGSLVNLLTNLFIGLSIGANVLVATFHGGKRSEETVRTVHTSMLVSLISGLILTAIGLVGARRILVWMDTPEEVVGLAAVYLRIYFCGMAAMMVYNFGAAILRAVGDTQRPLYYLSIAGVVNVLLNLFFVIVLKMSVAGVGLATVISQCVSAILVVRCMMKETGDIHLDLKALGIDWEIFVRILKIGVPASVQGLMFSISNVIIQSSINSFGAIVVAGNSAAGNIDGFVYVSMNAFYQANLSFTSQNMGAGRLDRINRIAITAECCTAVIGTLLGNLACIFGSSLLGIYSTSAEVIAAGLVRMNIVTRTYVLCGIMDVLVGSLRGIGYSTLPVIVSILGICGLRLGMIFTLFRIPALHTVSVLYLTYPVSWIVTFAVDLVCFLIARKKLNAKLLPNPAQ